MTPWIVAYQVSPSMGFSRQQYQSGLPFPSPGNLPNPGIEPGSPTPQAKALPSEPPGEGRVNSSRQRDTMLTLEYLLGARGMEAWISRGKMTMAQSRKVCNLTLNEKGRF